MMAMRATTAISLVSSCLISPPLCHLLLQGLEPGQLKNFLGVSASFFAYE
jgi:hypothetical protein